MDGVESSGEPEFSKETCEEFFKSKYVDENRDYEYAPPPGLFSQVLFDLEKPTFNDFWKIVKRKRNSSSPGINGNSYVVYKSSKKKKLIYCGNYFALFGKSVKSQTPGY